MTLAPIPPEWRIDGIAYSDTMTLTALVSIGGEDQAYGALAAFSGMEVRGVQSAPSFPSFGPHAARPLYFLTVYCTGAEKLTFWFANGLGATTLLNGVISPSVDSNVGTVNSPYMLAETTQSPHTNAPPHGATR